LADEQLLTSFEEGRLFGADWLRTLGEVPNEYLWYWYFRREAVAAAVDAAGETRGSLLAAQQQAFYDQVAREPSRALDEWRRVRRERDASYLAESRRHDPAARRDESDVAGGGYERVALAIMAAIARDERSVHILNVRNRGALSAFDHDAVVEVPCLVDGNGAHPCTVAPVEGHHLGLMVTMKAVERETIAAARDGSRDRALRAFALHPMVDSVELGRQLLDGYLRALPALAAALPES
jgi:6-phospho-beta-glucosidase